MTSIGEKGALYSYGCMRTSGRPPDGAPEAVDTLHIRGVMAEDQVAAARCYAAVDNRDAVIGACNLVERERILLEEGDVDDVLAGLEHALHGLESHGPGHSTDDEIGTGNEIAQCSFIAQIGSNALHPLNVAQTFEGCSGCIGYREIEFCREIAGDGRADPPGAEQCDVANVQRPAAFRPSSTVRNPASPQLMMNTLKPCWMRFSISASVAGMPHATLNSLHAASTC